MAEAIALDKRAILRVGMNQLGLNELIPWNSPKLPLNALRALRHRRATAAFTRAGLELRVSQTAISHQVKSLEDLLGVKLFRRLPRGLALTDEGSALAPVMSDVFQAHVCEP